MSSCAVEVVAQGDICSTARDAVCRAQDDLIDRLGGVDKVAELTGRRRRVVRDPDNSQFYYLPRAQDMPLDKVSCHITLTLLCFWFDTRDVQRSTRQSNVGRRSPYGCAEAGGR